MPRRAALPDFDDVINELEFAPSTEEGKGFLPPLLRGKGHLLALLSADTVTPEDIGHELDEVEKHWSQIFIDKRFSDKVTTYLEKMNTALAAAQAQHTAWEGEDWILKIRNLNNRSMGLASLLDREILGIRDTDPGLNV